MFIHEKLTSYQLKGQVKSREAFIVDPWFLQVKNNRLIGVSHKKISQFDPRNNVQHNVVYVLSKTMTFFCHHNSQD